MTDQETIKYLKESLKIAQMAALRGEIAIQNEFTDTIRKKLKISYSLEHDYEAIKNWNNRKQELYSKGFL